MTLTLGIGRSFTRTLNAVSVGPTSQIVLAPSSLTLVSGTPQTVTATPKDAASHTTADVPTYHSSNTAVATINSSGVVTWVSAGTTNLTATFGAITSNTVVVTAVGATVQIAGAPGSLSLAHGTSGTFSSVTPEDTNGVATGAQAYWRSSDSTIVRIDDPTTGARTVLGTIGQAVTITVNLVAPSSLSEPVRTTEDQIFGSDLTEYAGQTPADMFNANGGDDTTGPIRFRPTRTDAPWVSLVHRPDGTGVGFKMHGAHNAAPAQDYTYGNFQLVPTDNNGVNPGGGPVFNRMAMHLIKHRVKIDVSTNPVTTTQRYKGNEFLHHSETGRVQFYTTDFRRHTSSRLTHYGVLDGANFMWDASLANDPTDPSDNGPLAGGTQVIGPWVNEDMANSGKVFRLTHQYQPNSICAGTLDVFLQYGHFMFVEDLLAAGVSNGQRIKIAQSTAEFIVTELASFSWGGATRSHGYLVRQTNTTGVTATYTIRESDGYGDPALWFGGTAVFGDVGQTGHFSLSQAGILTTGDNGGYVTSTDGRTWRVKDFDGAHNCTLVKESSDILSSAPVVTRDMLGIQFNNIQDGIARMWIADDAATPDGLGALVMDISQTGIGVTPPGGEGHYCSRSCVAALAINDGIKWWWLFGAQTSGADMDYTYYGPVDWFIRGGRGSYP